MKQLSTQRILVWDLPTRLFHWLLVGLIACAWFTATMADDLMSYHVLFGYGITALLLFRVVWGFVGSTHSRFSDFLHRPTIALSYLRDMKAGRPTSYLGHNPLGGWMVAYLLLFLLIQGGSGLFASDDLMTHGPLNHLVSGEMSDLLSTVHTVNFYLLLALAAIHVCAVLAYRFLKGENLVLPMLTGYKTVHGESHGGRITASWLAILVLAASATAIWTIAHLA